jgi:uncharacterized protein
MMNEFLTLLIVSTAVLISLIGLLGCVLPILPGPVISFVALLLVKYTTDVEVSTRTLFFFGSLTVLVTLLDSILPIYMPRSFGASGWGVTGASAGLLIGLFFPPLGFIFGALIGAFLLEMIRQRGLVEALIAGLGSFIGFAIGTVAKVALAGAITGWLIFKALLPLT